MKTRSQRLQEERDGILPSPPRQLPETRRAPRAARSTEAKKAEPAPATGTENTRAARPRPTRKAAGNKRRARSRPPEESLQPDDTVIHCESPPPSTPLAPLAPLVPCSDSPSQQAAPRATRPPLAELSPAAVNSSERANAPAGLSDAQGIIHLWVNPTAGDLAASRPSTEPDVAKAVPSSLIPVLLELIASHVTPRPREMLTSNIASAAAQSSNKRKLDDDADASRPARRARVDNPSRATTINKGRSKGVFSRMPFKPTSPSEVVSVLAQPQVQVATPAPVPAPTPAPAPAPAPAPERGGTWGLSKLLSSARSVSKYLPMFTPKPIAVGLQAQTPASNPNSNSTSPQSQPHPNPPQTEPENRADTAAADTEITSTADIPTDQSPTQHPSTPKDQSQPQHQSTPKTARSQAEIEASRKRKAERKSLKAQTLTTMENDGSAGTDLPAHAEAKRPTATGKKRKRPPSPDEIPNPPGTSYGMDLDYFGWISSDEFEDEDYDEVETPIKRPNKTRRLSSPSNKAELSGNPQKAQPYTGVLFSDTTPTYHGGNVFEQVASTQKARTEALKTADEEKNQFLRQERLRQQGLTTPSPPKVRITNLMGSFRVPSPSDSDSDLEMSPKDSVERENSTKSVRSSPSKSNPERQNTKAAALSPKSKATNRSPKSKESKNSPKPKESNKTQPALRVSQSPRKGGTKSPISNQTITGRAMLDSASKGNSTPQPHEQSVTKATTQQTKAPEIWKQPPPPRPTPSHAALPSVASKDSDALALARKKALKHRPLKPSGLRESSRLSSPISTSEFADDGINNDGASSQRYPYIRATAKIQKQNQETTSGKHGLELSSPVKNKLASKELIQPNAYKEYCKTIDPKVAALLDHTPVNSELMASMIGHHSAGSAAKVSPTDQKNTKYPLTPVTSNPKIKPQSYTTESTAADYLNNSWTQSDEKRAAEGFEALYASWKKHNVEPGKEHDVEPGKEHDVEPGKKHDVEPGKKHDVEPGKKHDVEPGKKYNVELEKKIISEEEEEL